MKVFISLFFICSIVFGYSQNEYETLLHLSDENPDSVKALAFEKLNNSEQASDRAQWFHLIGKAYQTKSKIDSSNSYFLKEEQALSSFNSSLEDQITNKKELADNFYIQGQLIVADSLIQEALKHSKKTDDLELRAEVLLSAGWLARERGRHAEALDYYFIAEGYAKQLNDKELLYECYSKVAVVYHVMREFDTAKDYYDRALNLMKEENAVGKMARLYNNYGLLYQYQGQASKAIKYFERSIQMCDSLGNIRGVAIANENMGLVCYQDLKNYTLALNKFKRSLDIWRSFDDAYGQAQTLVYMIYVYNAQGRYQKAIDSSYRSLYFTQLSGAKDVERDLYKEMADAFEGLGKTSKAYEYYKKHISLRDSLKSINKLEEIKLMNIEHELAEKQIKDSLELEMQHEKESAKIHLSVQRQRWWMVILIAILIAVSVIGYLIFRSSQQRKKTAKVIEEKSLLLQTKNKEIIDSINYAKRIQSAILPKHELIKSMFKKSFILYLPKDIVAGDFYWVENAVDYRFFAVADCTGHGVPGAMVSVICSNALNKVVNEMRVFDPAKILEEVTKIVTETFEKGNHELHDGMDIALIRLKKEKDQTEMAFAGANNPVWIVRKNSSKVEALKGTKRPIGKFEVNIPFKTEVTQLQKDDLIYLFSDGYADQFGGEKNKKFKYKSLKRLFLLVATKPLAEQHLILEDTFNEWKGELEQIDDVCVAGIRV